jgi:glycosyltransferase involved in cell wall biosynthesis
MCKKNIKKRKKLVIISHTEHYLRNGEIVGWGSTVMEINFLAQFWEEVIHIACFHDKAAPASSLRYEGLNIRFVPIPPFGGKTFLLKLLIIFKMPNILNVIRKEIKNVSDVQLRLPTGIGIFLLPWFSIHKYSYTFWVKYAGNWVQKSPPIGYQFQRWWLRKNLAHCKVTINGNWPGQPAHILTFQNPCLTDSDRKMGHDVVVNKNFSKPYSACFVGRLEDEKGVRRILETAHIMYQKGIHIVHLVGDGPLKAEYEIISNSKPIKFIFHSFLDRISVFNIYKESHFFLLPSDSEGFPKVIAESANFGCIPIVSNVSCIDQYLNNENSFLWNCNHKTFSEFFKNILIEDSNELHRKAYSAHNFADLFTLEKYKKHLSDNVMNIS